MNWTELIWARQPVAPSDVALTIGRTHRLLYLNLFCLFFNQKIDKWQFVLNGAGTSWLTGIHGFPTKTAVNFLPVLVLVKVCLQCFDAVGWAAGRASGLWKLSGGVLAWLSVWSEVQTCIWPSWCHCRSLSLASVNPDWFYLSGTGRPG